MIAVSISLTQQKGRHFFVPGPANGVRPLTHSSYANGQSEIVMGDAIQRAGWQRSDLVISTKVDKQISDDLIPIANDGVFSAKLGHGKR